MSRNSKCADVSELEICGGPALPLVAALRAAEAFAALLRVEVLAHC